MRTLKDLRLDQRKPLREVCKALGLDTGRLSMFENHYLKVPVKWQEALAKYYGVNIQDIFTESGFAREK